MTAFKFCLSLLTAVFASAALAENAPVVRTAVIDTDGQVSPTQWRSSATWIWTQNHLRLQTAIEIPSHIAMTLPETMQTFVRGSTFKGPFKLQDDHEFLVLELRGPSALYKIGAQSLRVNVDYDHTNWMRNANCREANVALAEVEDSSPSPLSAFFISLYCRPAKQGTWIEISGSDDVSLSFEPHAKIRFQNNGDGTEFWLAHAPHPRVLSDVIVTAANGEVASRYELAADPVVPERIPVRRLANSSGSSDEAEPILLPVDSLNDSLEVSRRPSLRALLGVDAQLIDAHGSLDKSRTGKTSTEIALKGRAIVGETLEADLALPVRRLGAGLDAPGASTHLSYLNVGYIWPSTSRLTWTFGAQAAVLDVYSPARSTTVAISPSVTARLGSLYSMTLAPLDLASNFSFARARAYWPVTADQHNRITFEALVGRTWIEPQKESWSITGASLGFVGEF